MQLFEIPTASTSISAIGEYSAPWFSELLPIVYIVVGLSIGIMFTLWLIDIMNNVFERLTHHENSGYEAGASPVGKHYVKGPHGKIYY